MTSRKNTSAWARLLAAAAAMGSVMTADAFSLAPPALKRLHGSPIAQCATISCKGRRAPHVLGMTAKEGAGKWARMDGETLMCPTSTPATSKKSQITTFYPANKRVVALGDVHGDSYALSTVLWNAGLINEEGGWDGGDAILVQVGDVLDRGPDEAFCLALLLRLQQEAREVGGDVVMLLGNHEVMNSDLDYRYVDPLGWIGWDEESDQMLATQMAAGMQGKKIKKDKAEKQPNWKMLLDKATEVAEMVGRPAVKVLPPFMQGRIKALGGRQGALAKLPVVVTVGSTVFCHAGVMPEVVAYGLQRLNEETSSYLRGESSRKPHLLDSIPQISPIWHREFGKDSLEFDELALEAADGAMRLLGCKRMVIGHTPQSAGINCVRTPEGREIWRVDTGMSQGIAQGPLETLEIASDGLPEEAVQILRGTKPVPAERRTVQGGVKKELSLEKELHVLRMKDSIFGPAGSSVMTPNPAEGSRAKLAPYMRPRIEV